MNIARIGLYSSIIYLGACSCYLTFVAETMEDKTRATNAMLIGLAPSVVLGCVLGYIRGR